MGASSFWLKYGGGGMKLSGDAGWGWPDMFISDLGSSEETLKGFEQGSSVFRSLALRISLCDYG